MQAHRTGPLDDLEHNPRVVAARILLAKAQGHEPDWADVLLLCAHTLGIELTDVEAYLEGDE